ncbi:MAG: alkaline phosphatase D family protein [Rubrivivax sp.]|jgi:alkaline phosphatase D|nr:alkaline phosphatase D family protein [Rubrivivax sp.]
MGHPIRSAPPRREGNRRDFFRRTGSAAAALAALPMLPVTAGAASASGVFRHGVASGDPLADRVVLWTRVTVAAAAVRVRYVVATDPALSTVVASGAMRTSAARDFTVKVDAAGLQPGTTYYYRFECDGEISPVGRTRTLPVGDVSRLRMAVVSCSNHAAGYFNAYARIAERADLDLVLHLGDYFYEYGTNVYGSVRPTEPPTETVTLADYRTRHAQYKNDPDLQEVHRQHPMIAIWDDHEVTNDSWQGGAENHTEGAEGAWPQRVAEAVQAYREWLPVRDWPLADPKRLQRAFRFGNLAEIVMLESRLQGRSQQLDATIPVPGLGNVFAQAGDFLDPARSLLGDRQEAWLAGRLRTSRGLWKFIGQQVMFAHLKAQGAPLAAGGGLFFNPDQWDGYQPARDRVYDVIKGSGGRRPVRNVVVLTGDIHSSWANDLTQDPNNPDVAGGGYDARSGEGSRAVEFVTTSVSSPGLSDPNGTTAAFVRSVNPHIKYVDFNRRGYLLVDATPERVVGEWWYVDTVEATSAAQTFGAAFEVREGEARLRPATATEPPADPPAPAP